MKKLLNKLTPNLIVASIEECLPFWVDRLGFTRTVEVPDGNRLGFVILARDGLELMLQSRSSLEKDVPAVAGGAPHRAVLYFEVKDLDLVRAALAGWPDAVPERTTFYGAREIIVRDPEGNAVFFSAHAGG